MIRKKGEDRLNGVGDPLRHSKTVSHLPQELPIYGYRTEILHLGLKQSYINYSDIGLIESDLQIRRPSPGERTDPWSRNEEERKTPQPFDAGHDDSLCGEQPTGGTRGLDC